MQPGKTWLPFSSESVLNTNGLGLVQSPEILVEPNDWVDVVFVGEGGGYGIYLDRSSSPTIQNGWNATPTRVVTFQNVTDYPFDSMDTYDATEMTGHPTIAGIPAYPSVAIGTIPYGDTYLYMAYMDQNPDAIGQSNGPFSIYTLQYDLSNPAPVAPSQVGQLSSVTNEWMPSLTLSPDGSYAFIGFYGGNGDYDPVTGTADEQYNTFYITGATNAGGINWSAPTQITNVDASSGQPTGGYFDQPNGRKSGAQEWNPDYDSASADYQNFHYSFMETSDEQVHDSGGNPVTLDAQEDVYMANVPIPYNGGTPAMPTGLNVSATSIGSGNLTLTWKGLPYSGTSANAYVEYSTAGQGWLPFGQAVASFGSVTAAIPNYSVDTTYYFRVRAQNAPNSSADASSAWSAVVQSWTGATYTPDLWYYAAGTVTIGQVVHTLYNFDFAYPSDGEAAYGDLQWWDSSHQQWDQVDHILLSSAGGLAYYFDPTAASGQSGVQITSSDQFRIHFDNPFGGSTAWLQLYPNLQTPANAPVEPQYIDAVMSDDGQTLEVTWDATGYDSNTSMKISVTGSGSEWWDPDKQQIIWLVQTTAAQDGSASINVTNDGELTITFQTTDSLTGQISDLVYYYLPS